MEKYWLKHRKKKETEAYEDTAQPWHQQPDESDTAYEAFKIFRLLGFSRDLEKVAMRVYGAAWEGNIRFVVDWYNDHNWEQRAALWDQYQDQYHEQIKVQAQKNAESKYIDVLPDVQDTQIDIALGKKKGDRVQGAMITRIIDQMVPKPQQKPQEVNVWQNVQMSAPELPGEVKSGLLDKSDNADYEDIKDQASKLIPDKLKNRK